MSFSLFIEQPCILCGDIIREPNCLCQACQQELPYIHSACFSCGLPLEPSVESDCCGQCVSSPPPTKQCISLFHYQAPVDYLIKHMKYHNQLTIAEMMGKALAKKIRKLSKALPEQIIPVPLHVERLKQRGYNQAIEISRQISTELNIPLNLTDCSRIKHTSPQFDIPATQRSKNIKNAFEISSQLQARHIALVDDVMTTGSTVWEIANSLLKSGVEQVDVWVCARATT